MVASLAFSKVFEQRLRWLIRSFNQYVVADQKTSEVGNALNIAGIGGAIKLCVVIELDLSFDRAATFDRNRPATAEISQFLVGSIDEQTEIVRFRGSLANRAQSLLRSGSRAARDGNVR